MKRMKDPEDSSPPTKPFDCETVSQTRQTIGRLELPGNGLYMYMSPALKNVYFLEPGTG